MNQATASRYYLAGMALVFYLAMIVVNGLANALPIGGRNTGELSALYPNLFVPAGFTFSIWGIIYLLLGVYVAALFVRWPVGNAALASVYTKVAVLFCLTCLANMGWILLWHHLKIGWSVLVMLVLLATLIIIFLTINKHADFKSRTEYFTVYLPFNVYLGWISVAMAANITVFLVSINWEGWGLGQSWWAAAVVGVAVFLALIMLLAHGNLPYAVVIFWALFGIAAKQYGTGSGEGRIVALSAISGMALLMAAAIIGFVKGKLVLPGGFNSGA